MKLLDRIKRLFEPEEEPAFFELNQEATIKEQNKLLRLYLEQHEKDKAQIGELKQIVSDQNKYIGLLIDKEERRNGNNQ